MDFVDNRNQQITRKKTFGEKRKFTDLIHLKNVDNDLPTKKRKLSEWRQKEQKYDRSDDEFETKPFVNNMDPAQVLSVEQKLRKMERLLYKLSKSFVTKQQHMSCMKLLKRIANNLMLHPMDRNHHIAGDGNEDPSKYRKLNLENDKLKQNVFKYEAALNLLRLIGFEKRNSYLLLPEHNENMVVFQALVVKISNSQPAAKFVENSFFCKNLTINNTFKQPMAESVEQANVAPMDIDKSEEPNPYTSQSDIESEEETNNNNQNNKENNQIQHGDKDNHDTQNSEESMKISTQPKSTQNDVIHRVNGTTEQESLLTQINEWIAKIPSKIDQCSKAEFHLILLLKIEVENIDKSDKIDYLLLFNFLQNVAPFKSFPFKEFGKNMSKFTKDDIAKLFTENSDFNAPKISEIFHTLFAVHTTKIVKQFQETSAKIDMAQTVSKIRKCAAELSVNDEKETECENKEEEEKGIQLAAGKRIDCCDRWGTWCLTQIKRHKKAGDRIENLEHEVRDDEREEIERLQLLEAVYVHYIGWNNKYDEWVFIDTDGDIFCDCDDRCDNRYDDEHRVAEAKTQSEYAKKRKKKAKKAKTEPIQYDIEDMDELVLYIDKTYNAPKGRNRTGIGAERYAKATLDGPGGNLKSFKLWDVNKQYDQFHHSHYDWWMFPNDRQSWGQGKKYAVFQQDIDALLQVDGYVENYKLGTKLVLKSWGWDMDKMCFIEDGTRDQRWTGYNVRLLKMLYSTIILKQWDVYKSVYLFCIGLLKKGHQFRSEPMMYPYLGLEKPKYVSRYRW